jgi:two-component system C4-dicarboxylate transport sensor histidine kinase DctB
MNRMTPPPQKAQGKVLPKHTRVIMWMMIAQLLFVACISGGHLMRQYTATELKEETATLASFRAAQLRTEIERYRTLPAVLSHDEDVRATLSAPSPAAVSNLERKLEQISRETGVNVLYIVDLKGFGVATGAKGPNNIPMFCSQGCSSRFYFSEAVRTGSAQFYSLGRPNQRAGMYFSHLVESRSGVPLGVLVAKVEFAPMQEQWRELNNPTFVADENGVILISSVPEWLGRAVTPLAPGLRERLRASRQFGILPLDPMPFSVQEAAKAPIQIRQDLGGDPGVDRSIVASVPLDVPGWRMYMFRPADHALNRATGTGAIIVLLAGVLLATIISVLLRRHQRRQAEFRQQIMRRQELEQRVAERTRALSTANVKLLNEIDGRRRMEGDLHRLQDELVQANKLAALGQIAAGVAHEVNQPLAAIRTYAANGRKFMLRGDMAEAAENFVVIDDLTERIKLITDELRAFSRRTPRQLSPVPVADAIAGALLLINHRLDLESVNLVRNGPEPGLLVIAERIRLEQVLVNLLQNALDALADRKGGRIALTVRSVGDRVSITVADNGPGLSREAAESLFMPFSTTKAQGLGLGLVICREIATEMGGDLVLDPVRSGASFTLTLNGAPQPAVTESAAVL